MRTTISIFLISLFMVACTPKNNTGHIEQYNTIVKELSSKEYSGRNNLNDGEKRAAEYIMEKFNTMCSPKYVTAPTLQPFSYPLNVMRGEINFSVDGTEYIPNKDYVVKEFSSSCKKSMPIIYALEKEYYTPEDFCSKINNLNATNSFVVIDFSLFSKLHGKELYLEYLKPLNVGGVIFKYNSKPNYFKARSGYTLPFPIVCVGEEFPNNAKSAEVEIESQMIPEHNSNNIIATIEGSKHPNKYYLFIAHYDHLGLMGKDNLYPGANDNSSGVAALLTLAQHYSQPENRPEYSMIFLWAGGEESNLLGSKYYVNNPIYPLEDIKYLFNLDMIGDTPNELVYETNSTGKEGAELLLKINSDNQYFPLVTNNPLCDNSDHYYFAIKDVPIIYFESKGDFYQYYHTPEDTFEHTSTESYQRIYKMILEFITVYGK